MAARFAGFDSMGGIKSAWSTITDTSLRFYDMQDFSKKIEDRAHSSYHREA